LAIWGNEIRWNETKHVELEQFWHAFTSRGFDSVSWAFLLWIVRFCLSVSASHSFLCSFGVVCCEQMLMYFVTPSCKKGKIQLLTGTKDLTSHLQNIRICISYRYRVCCHSCLTHFVTTVLCCNMQLYFASHPLTFPYLCGTSSMESKVYDLVFSVLLVFLYLLWHGHSQMVLFWLSDGT